MKITLLYILIIAIGISCNAGKHEMKDNYIDKSSSFSHIKFDFIAKKIDSTYGIVEIKGTLSNDNKDTVYFLTSTCDGLQYSLHGLL